MAIENDVEVRDVSLIYALNYYECLVETVLPNWFNANIASKK